MREFKIRIWDIKDNDWFYTVPGKPEDHNLIDTIYFEQVSQDESKYIWEQYTGLKDKNGKEIYEGDIVKFCSDSYEVKFDTMYDKDCDAGCYLCWLCENKHRVHSLYDAQYDLEVVGNIHENKELLK